MDNEYTQEQLENVSRDLFLATMSGISAAEAERRQVELTGEQRAAVVREAGAGATKLWLAYATRPVSADESTEQLKADAEIVYKDLALLVEHAFNIVLDTI